MADKTKDADAVTKNEDGATQNADAKTQATGAATGDVKLVRMTRSDPQMPGGPTEADVHPDEVDGWRTFGWQAGE